MSNKRQPKANKREAESESNSEEFTVEQIVNKRIRAGNVEYLLKWKGYDR